MDWIVWSNGKDYGCCKYWDNSERAVFSLTEEGFDVYVWDFDFDEFETDEPKTLILDDLEKWAVLRALDLKGWSQKKAAKLLGISARAMNSRVVKHKIINNNEPGNGKSTWTKNSKR